MLAFDRSLLDGLPLEQRIEIEENISRKPFTEAEIAKIQQLLHQHYTTVYRRGQTQGPHLDSVLEPRGKGQSDLRVDDLIGAAFGEGRETVRKRRVVLEASEKDPELLEKLNTEGLNTAYSTATAPSRAARGAPETVRFAVSLPVEAHRRLNEALGIVGGSSAEALMEIVDAYLTQNR